MFIVEFDIVLLGIVELDIVELLPLLVLDESVVLFPQIV
jgi:hypothetical protein